MHKRIKQLYENLMTALGPQGWWPGDSPLEVAVGAILTQNTNWQNVALAIARLKQAGLLNASALHHVPPEELAAYIRPAGYFRVKAQRLKNFIDYLMTTAAGSMAKLAARPLQVLRRELLAVNGIGPETADSILLYALDKPIFVVDAYTYRIFARHQLVVGPYKYEDLQALCHAALPAEVALYQEFHALLVRCGKDYCKPRPRCQTCPLGSDLAPGQPA